MYAYVQTPVLGTGFTLDGSGYRRDTKLPAYIREAQEHRAKAKRRARRGTAILLIPDAPIIAAGTGIGGLIGGVPGAAVGTRVGAGVSVTLNVVGVSYLASGAYHGRRARRVQRRGANRSGRAVRRDARRRK